MPKTNPLQPSRQKEQNDTTSTFFLKPWQGTTRRNSPRQLPITQLSSSSNLFPIRSEIQSRPSDSNRKPQKGGREPPSAIFRVCPLQGRWRGCRTHRWWPGFCNFSFSEDLLLLTKTRRAKLFSSLQLWPGLTNHQEILVVNPRDPIAGPNLMKRSTLGAPHHTQHERAPGHLHLAIIIHQEIRKPSTFFRNWFRGGSQPDQSPEAKSSPPTQSHRSVSTLGPFSSSAESSALAPLSLHSPGSWAKLPNPSRSRHPPRCLGAPCCPSLSPPVISGPQRPASEKSWHTPHLLMASSGPTSYELLRSPQQLLPMRSPWHAPSAPTKSLKNLEEWAEDGHCVRYAPHRLWRGSAKPSTSIVLQSIEP